MQDATDSQSYSIYDVEPTPVNYFDVLFNRKNGLGYAPNSTPEKITNEYSGHNELLRSALAESWRAE
jgi:hypothetical protein